MCERLGFGKCNPTPFCLMDGAVGAHRKGLRWSWSWNASVPSYRLLRGQRRNPRGISELVSLGLALRTDAACSA